MEDVLQVGVGVRFQERLAELIWENCSELARQTAAGKMALAVDPNARRIQDQILAALVPEVVKGLKGEVTKQVKERLKDRVIQEVAKNVVIDITTAMQNQFERLVHSEVTKHVKAKVEAEFQQEFGKGSPEKNITFASYVRKRLDAIVDEELGQRLRLNEAAQDAIDAKVGRVEAGRG